MMPFSVDYAPAIPFWAHYTNYRRLLNVPKGWVLHTPQEPADSWAYTPRYFAEPNRDASTHYFVSYDGDVYQCVPDRFMAIANGVIGKPYSSWASAARTPRTLLAATDMPMPELSKRIPTSAWADWIRRATSNAISG